MVILFIHYSYHLFQSLVNDIYRVFDKYEYQDVIDEIDQPRIELTESLENFADHFLHLCYQFLNEDVEWQFLDENFGLLFWMSRPNISNQILLTRKNFNFHKNN